MIIAFHGRLGSGKDTAGERLAAMAGLDAVRLSFAAKLKASAAALLDIDPAEWETYKNDPEVKIMLSIGYVDEVIEQGQREEIFVLAPNVTREFTAREFLQRYGTESHRDVFGTNFWVEQALSDYTPRQDEFAYVTDCGFENEAVAVRSLGGVIVRVLGENENTGGHASEAGLPDELVTLVIDNSVRDDDFAHLDYQLRNIASMIGLPLKVLSR